MTEHQPPRRRWPGRYDKPFLIRLEISHADDTTPTLLAALQSLLRLEARRTGELPTSDVTCLLWQTSPQHAIDDLERPAVRADRPATRPNRTRARQSSRSFDPAGPPSTTSSTWATSNPPGTGTPSTTTAPRTANASCTACTCQPQPTTPTRSPSPAANPAPPPGSAGSAEQSGDCLDGAPPSAQAIGAARS